MSDYLFPWLKFTHASPECFAEYNKLIGVKTELAEATHNLEVAECLVQTWINLTKKAEGERADQRQRAEKAEAELADLKAKRIDVMWLHQKIDMLKAELAEAKTDRNIMGREVKRVEAERDRLLCLIEQLRNADPFIENTKAWREAFDEEEGD